MERTPLKTIWLLSLLGTVVFYGPVAVPAAGPDQMVRRLVLPPS